MTDRPNLADTVPEPPDGATRVFEREDGERYHICRNDALSRSEYGDCLPPEARWYTDNGFEPCDEPPETWREALYGAVRLYDLTLVSEHPAGE